MIGTLNYRRSRQARIKAWRFRFDRRRVVRFVGPLVFRAPHAQDIFSSSGSNNAQAQTIPYRPIDIRAHSFINTIASCQRLSDQSGRQGILLGAGRAEQALELRETRRPIGFKDGKDFAEGSTERAGWC
jgi:hypothetical protein